MKRIKLKITVNGQLSTMTTTRKHNESEVLRDIIIGIIKELYSKEQKFVIIINHIVDSGYVSLSCYNNLKNRIVVVLEECFVDKHMNL